MRLESLIRFTCSSLVKEGEEVCEQCIAQREFAISQTEMTPEMQDTLERLRKLAEKEIKTAPWTPWEPMKPTNPGDPITPYAPFPGYKPEPPYKVIWGTDTIKFADTTPKWTTGSAGLGSAV